MITGACCVLSARAWLVGAKLPSTMPWPALAAFLLSIALGGAGLVRLASPTPEQARAANALATIAAATAAVSSNATEAALATLEAQAAEAATAAAHE